MIEVSLGGAQDVMGIPRKQRGLGNLRIALARASIEGLAERMSDNALGAVMCALVGKLFLEGKTANYGTGQQVIVMPEGEKADCKLD